MALRNVACGCGACYWSLLQRYAHYSTSTSPILNVERCTLVTATPTSPSRLQAAPLDLSRLQDLLGDQLFLAALRGTDPYLYAAIKSLPLMDSTAAGSEAAGGRGADVRTAEALLSQVEQQVAQGGHTRTLLRRVRHLARVTRLPQ